MYDGFFMISLLQVASLFRNSNCVNAFSQLVNRFYLQIEKNNYDK